MKGITEIELTDVHTGKVEKYKETNLVTNAMADFFSHNINGMLFTIEGNTNDLNGNMLPLCKNAIGGILLFSDTIEEDANKYYAPSANPCVGYASNDVNATTNIMRGSMNLTETKKLDNGYKFVWDFTTSQANGTISCVALTHKWAGIAYMGDGYNGTGFFWTMRSRSANSSGIARTAYINAVEINPEENYFWTIGINTSNELIIQKIRMSFTAVGLNDTMLGTNYDVLFEIKLNPTMFVMSNPSNNEGAYDFFDGKDGYWYGFWAGSNKSGNANMIKIKINKSDFSFIEERMTLNGVTCQAVGYHGGYNTNPQRNVQSVLQNGYLYMVSYDKTKVYKINIENAADIKEIPLGSASAYNCNGDYYRSGSMWLANLGDWIVGSDFRINTEDKVFRKADSTPWTYTSTPLFQYGPYLFSFGGYYANSTRQNLFLWTPYLATINNLETSVIKTADKTMKITYTIVEE